ncbi:hypothetical protein [Sphingomonas montanisoli]|uniref:Uncharacterized protein n=1 Tax=Sphingomonas montanisoli TaxID=2606412 RepID=A0A5D9CDG5_9SPHN|nr:hypothetical protein [Sphingomonas montanisoli]TZG29060.1 hypothetical protein FYJ91_02680 [Sphingomonas montanisoli]
MRKMNGIALIGAAAMALWSGAGWAQGAACTSPPATGARLAGDMKLAEEGHAIDISNDSDSDAVIKLRHVDTGKLAASFYIAHSESMTIEGVPDGAYLLQYAFGPGLGADCRALSSIIKANQMPGADDLRTETIDDEDHTEVKRRSVSYALSVSQDANVHAVGISAAAFNAD